MKTPKLVRVVYYYNPEDKSCSEDYEWAAVYFDEELVLKLGDSYHDKSGYQIKGFLTACKMLIKDFPKEVEEHTPDNL